MERTLLLTQSYEPIKVISWQRAISLLFLGKAEVVVEYEHSVRSVSMMLKIPAVVRLVRSFRRHHKPVKFSRVNIYTRDGHRCQYCGRKAAASELTYDHVIPRSKGGKTDWQNIVTACSDCNRKKANRSPREAGMTLLATPTQPNWLPAVMIRLAIKTVPDAWRDYLAWAGEIGEQTA